MSEVRAAGGVVMRGRGRDTDVLVVHRPRYDDWSLPKGKLHIGESFAAAAVREVIEETGVVCRLGRELGTVRYRDRNGRPKVVRYWLMHPTDERPFRANDEVDEAPWLPVRDAMAVLTYSHDQDLVRRARRS